MPAVIEKSFNYMSSLRVPILSGISLNYIHLLYFEIGGGGGGITV